VASTLLALSKHADEAIVSEAADEKIQRGKCEVKPNSEGASGGGRYKGRTMQCREGIGGVERNHTAACPLVGQLGFCYLRLRPTICGSQGAGNELVRKQTGALRK
jgi:hypothetical protein